MGFEPLPQPRHEMVLDPESAEDERWSCPTCGRVMVMRWLPEVEHVVLTPGDEYAIHVGGKGGAQVGSIGTSVRDQGGEARMRAWLDENGISWDGPAA